MSIDRFVSDSFLHMPETFRTGVVTLHFFRKLSGKDVLLQVAGNLLCLKAL